MNCTRCNGTGKNKYDGRTCYACDGKGQFPAPDYKQILKALLVNRKGKQTFRASAPKGRETAEQKRIYYVWRLTRFHGGADVTMPVMAETCISGDPYAKELDKFAGMVAQRVYGTQMAAAYRWGSIFGAVKSVPAGLPGSAYPGGMATDENKPLEELAEIL